MSGSEVGLICGVAIFLFPDPMLSGICFTDFILLSDAKTIRRDFGKQTIPIRQYIDSYAPQITCKTRP